MSEQEVVRFRGGIRRSPFGSGATWPFGHLEFDVRTLSIFGPSDRVDVTRSEVDHIRVRGGRVCVVRKDGEAESLYFAALSLKNVRRELERLGWPVRG